MSLSTMFQLYRGGGNWSTRRKPQTCRKSLLEFDACNVVLSIPHHEWDSNSQRWW